MDSVRILSFDPGLTHLGWACGVYTATPEQLKILDYGVVDPGKELDKACMRSLLELCGRRLLTLFTTENIIQDLMSDFQPDYVCSEDAFFNHFRPSAYAPLLQWLTVVEMYLWRHYNKRLYKFAPKAIKRTVFTGTATKEAVQSAIRRLTPIVWEESEKCPLQEHAADAIACSWTFCQQVLVPLSKETPNAE